MALDEFEPCAPNPYMVVAKRLDLKFARALRTSLLKTSSDKKYHLKSTILAQSHVFRNGRQWHTWLTNTKYVNTNKCISEVRLLAPLAEVGGYR